MLYNLLIPPKKSFVCLLHPPLSSFILGGVACCFSCSYHPFLPKFCFLNPFTGVASSAYLILTLLRSFPNDFSGVDLHTYHLLFFLVIHFLLLLYGHSFITQVPFCSFCLLSFFLLIIHYIPALVTPFAQIRTPIHLQRDPVIHTQFSWTALHLRQST